MNAATDTFVLKGGHVIDAEQGIDGVADVHVAGGKIQHVGSREPVPGEQVIDVSGNYVSAGWVDIHVHAYGTLGFCQSRQRRRLSGRDDLRRCRRPWHRRARPVHGTAR